MSLASNQLKTTPTKRVKTTVEHDIFLVDIKEIAKAEKSPRVGFAKSLRDLLK